MKIHCDLPWGGYVELEREPLSSDQLESLSFAGITIGGIFGILLLVILAMILG